MSDIDVSESELTEEQLQAIEDMDEGCPSDWTEDDNA